MRRRHDASTLPMTVTFARLSPPDLSRRTIEWQKPPRVRNGLENETIAPRVSLRHRSSDRERAGPDARDTDEPEHLRERCRRLTAAAKGSHSAVVS